MTKSQEQEFDVLGCKVKYKPEHDETNNAKAVIESVLQEVTELKAKRPLLRDTDVAVLVALKLASDKMQLEDEYKTNVLKLEESLSQALKAVSVEAI